METILSVFFWVTVMIYAVSFALFSVALVFRKTNLLNAVIRVTLIGFTLHTAIATARWVETGYPPFVSYFEAMSASAWFGVLIFLLLQQWKPFVRSAGVGIIPFIFLLMGWAGTHPFGEKILPVSLKSFWLFIHASFATAAGDLHIYLKKMVEQNLAHRWVLALIIYHRRN